MAKIPVFSQNIFGSTAGLDQISQFGSLASGSVAYTNDPAIAQALSNWLTGWFAAVIGGNAPTIEDMNGAFFVITSQLAYFLQAGTPEWNAGTTYYVGSFAQVAGVTYVSKTNSNLNNLVTSTTNWKKIGGDIMSTLGDMMYATSNGDVASFSGNTSATTAILTQTGDGVNSGTPSWRLFKAPTIQKLTGSGTYTTPSGCLYIRVRAAGGGGGGGGSGNSASGGNGANGGDTSFGSSLLVASGGGGGTRAGNAPGGVGGLFTVNSPAVDCGSFVGVSGQSSGGAGNGTSIFEAPGNGGAGYFGSGATGTGVNSAGTAAVSGSGGGGSGGGGGSTGAQGAGGGGGGGVNAAIYSPSATYTYVVGAGGLAGTAGTSGALGGVGGSGMIVVEEYYQ